MKARKPPAAPSTAAPDDDRGATETPTEELPSGNRQTTADLASELPEGRPVDAWLQLGGFQNQDAVTVLRRPESGGADEFLFTVPAETPPEGIMKQLRRDYGPGEYRFQIRQGGRITKNSVIAIAAEPKPRDDRAPVREEPRGFDPMTYFMQQAQESQKQLMQLMTAALGRPLPPERAGVDVAKVLGAASPLLIPVVTGIVELMKGTKPDPIKLVKDFAEIRALLTSEDDSPSPAGTWDVVLQGVKSLGPVLMQGLQAQAARQAAAPPRSTVGPGPQRIAAPGAERSTTGTVDAGGAGSAPPAASTPAASGAATADGLPPELAATMSVLIAAAAKGKEPGAYVEMVLDMLPLPPEQLHELLRSGMWLPALAQIDARVEGHAAWFTALRDELLLEFSEGDGGDGKDETTTSTTDATGEEVPAT